MTKGTKILVALGALYALKYAEKAGYRKGRLDALKPPVEIKDVQLDPNSAIVKKLRDILPKEEETPEEEVKEESDS